MAQNEYQHAVTACYVAASMLMQFDLDAVLEQISEAEAVGPLIDPTLYREKGGAMQEDKQIVEAARQLQRVAKRLKSLTED